MPVPPTQYPTSIRQTFFKRYWIAVLKGKVQNWMWIGLPKLKHRNFTVSLQVLLDPSVACSSEQLDDSAGSIWLLIWALVSSGLRISFVSVHCWTSGHNCIVGYDMCLSSCFGNEHFWHFLPHEPIPYLAVAAVILLDQHTNTTIILIRKVWRWITAATAR